jgi:Holliday junction resolvase RusA-like endonuclease
MNGRLEIPTGMLVVNLPLPPSVNGLWIRGKKHVYKSKKYNEWQGRASKLIYDEAPNWTTIEGRYDLEMVIPDITR